ncbi:MAG: endonuclease III [Spirochaetaceae bacterium]|jgi:endonuclease-3|nr:endonuclease III [Spirochaetaceae bacterium]
MNIQWDTVVRTLENWQAGLDAPSVTTIASRYRHDGWAVLTSTIISLRTKDDITLVRSAALLARAPSPHALLELNASELEKLIYPAGFYKTKAKNMLQIAKIILEKYGGAVPSDMDALLALPGVGRKTANLVLIEAYDKDGICVDTHVHRISNRCGWLTSKTPEETEMLLRKILPLQFWKRINPLLVLYGQQVCRPQSPFCSRCVITSFCTRIGVERTR